MGRYIKPAAFFFLGLLALAATATDFKCADTVLSLAGLPAELKTETSAITAADNRRFAMVAESARFISGNRLITPGVSSDSRPSWPFDTRVRILKDDQTQRIVDRQSGMIATDVERPTTSANFNRLKTALSKSGACDAAAVGTWAKLDAAFMALGASATEEALAREYLADPNAFKKAHQADIVDAFLPLMAATVDVLNKCFMPAESAAYESNHHLLQQMGRLVYGADAECTATLIGDARYAITARHCFEPMKNFPEKYAADMWFIPYRSANRYQVCAIAEGDALAADKFGAIDHDQVLVRLAPTGIQVKPVKVARLAELATTDEEKAGNHNAPTLLQSVSYFPLAKYALPKKFETGYVVPQMEVCAAVSKTDACFSHICSAVPGGSGSPIFASDAQGIVLVGTHIGGGATEISQDCKAPPGVQTNSAAIVNTSRAPQFFAASAQSPGG